VASQRKLLDYSSSINDELEAGALLGRSISFQKARQLAYEGDIAGAAKATLDTVKKAGDFDKMTVYQREALAKASGMELKDLTKMMAVEKQRDEIMLRGTDAQKEKLRAQEEALQKLKEEADLNKQSLLDENEKAIMQQKMQGLVTQLKNMWDSIVLQLGSVLEPIIRSIVKQLTPLAQGIMPLIVGAAKVLGWAFQMVFSIVEGLASPFIDLIKEMSDMLEMSEGFKEYMKEAEEALTNYVLPAFKAIGMLIGKLILEPIKQVFKLVGTLTGIIVSVFSGDMGIGEGILEGLKAVGGAVFDALIAPFVDVWKWLKKTVMGESPSELGLGIVDGILSVGSMIFDALVFPFKKIWEFVSGLFSGEGGIIGSIVKGFDFVKSAFSTVIDGIKNVADGIFDFITSPFKKAVNFVKGLPLIGKLFGGADDISKQVSPAAASTQTVQTSSVVEVAHLDELRDVVEELTNAVANLGSSSTTTIADGAKFDTSALESKLDILTGLLVGGAVRVYLDGKDVSSAMAGTGR
jgi:phage-related protein